MSACSTTTTTTSHSHFCRDTAAATHLKLIAITVIFVSSIIGINSPILLAKSFHHGTLNNNNKKKKQETAVLLIKCFAAGVILSTSLVHVLPDAFSALTNCSVNLPDFPFAGLVVLLGALMGLLVDLTALSHVDEKEYKAIGEEGEGEGKLQGEVVVVVVDEEEMMVRKSRMVSKVLEIGIVFHSVIIGVTMGMSQNKCTIRPLVAALAFHQVFEGMGLGGCIAQAAFGFGTTALMCFMFSVTTPAGIILGMIVFALTGFDDSNVNALIMEGLLGSLSSGILIYMALVDLISPEFFHNKMMSSCGSGTWLKKYCFIALVLGSASMSILALWA
ncbi:Zinc transporter 6, chloroplastic-like protein [Drosera capensis]